MDRFISLTMYVLWILTIIFILAATFNNFQYEDLNTLAIVLLACSLLNSILMVTRKKAS